MAITYMTGNLIHEAKNYDIIIHGCNCFNTMGAGLADQIRREFPESYIVDCNTIKGDKSKLGTISYTFETKPTIVNAYIQFDYGRSGQYINYEALEKCMQRIALQFKGCRMAMGKIGCGLAGGDWTIVETIINYELNNEDVTVIVLEI